MSNNGGVLSVISVSLADSIMVCVLYQKKRGILVLYKTLMGIRKGSVFNYGNGEHKKHLLTEAQPGALAE